MTLAEKIQTRADLKITHDPRLGDFEREHAGDPLFVKLCYLSDGMVQALVVAGPMSRTPDPGCLPCQASEQPAPIGRDRASLTAAARYGTIQQLGGLQPVALEPA